MSIPIRPAQATIDESQDVPMGNAVPLQLFKRRPLSQQRLQSNPIVPQYAVKTDNAVPQDSTVSSEKSSNGFPSASFARPSDGHSFPRSARTSQESTATPAPPGDGRTLNNSPRLDNAIPRGFKALRRPNSNTMQAPSATISQSASTPAPRFSNRAIQNFMARASSPAAVRRHSSAPDQNISRAPAVAARSKLSIVQEKASNYHARTDVHTVDDDQPPAPRVDPSPLSQVHMPGYSGHEVYDITMVSTVSVAYPASN